MAKDSERFQHSITLDKDCRYNRNHENIQQVGGSHAPCVQRTHWKNYISQLEKEHHWMDGWMDGWTSIRVIVCVRS